MAEPFPHQYQVDLTWTGTETSTLSAGPRSLSGGPPAQFGGTDETRWSPEHLILAALAQCLMLTWIALNKRSQIPLKAWACAASSVLDKTREGLTFTAFKLEITIKTDAARADEAKRLVETAKKHCIIANSLKTPSELLIHVQTP